MEQKPLMKEAVSVRQSRRGIDALISDQKALSFDLSFLAKMASFSWSGVSCLVCYHVSRVDEPCAIPTYYPIILNRFLQLLVFDRGELSFLVDEPYWDQSNQALSQRHASSCTPSVRTNSANLLAFIHLVESHCACSGFACCSGPGNAMLSVRFDCS